MNSMIPSNRSIGPHTCPQEYLPLSEMLSLWISMPVRVCLGIPLNVSIPQGYGINHFLDYTCLLSYLNSFMISDTILLWMNSKYTTSPTVYKSLDLQFHEDDPTSL